MSSAGLLFLLKIVPRVDKVIIPRTKGRLSSIGFDKVGLLTTTGAKSHRQRTQPVTVIDDGGGLIVIGSNYGRPSHPAWTYNLDADPRCTVVFRGRPTPYRAELLHGADRAHAWAVAVDFYAGYGRYQVNATPRSIKLYRLRVASGSPAR